MVAAVGASSAQDSAGLGRLGRRVVGRLGGRYSAELGIDVDAGDAEIERWFLAATLFGTRITAHIAARTFGVLAGAGVSRIGQARHISQGAFIAYLDEGDYARYDARAVAWRSRRSTCAASTPRATSASPAPGLTRMFPASPSSPPNLTPIPGTSKADWSGPPSRITTGEWAPAQVGTVASC